MRTNINQVSTVFLVLMTTVPIEGQMLTAGTLLEMTEPEAKGLLKRNKARLATADDMPTDREAEALAAAEKAEADKAAAEAAELDLLKQKMGEGQPSSKAEQSKNQDQDGKKNGAK